jgi:hypothetical protein
MPPDDTNRSQSAAKEPPRSIIGVLLVVIAIGLILDGAETIFDYHTESWQHEGKLMIMFGVLILGVGTAVRQLTRIEFELRRK